MIDYLYSIDVAIFFFINHSLANPIFDWIMPFITDLNKKKPVLVLLGIFILLFAWKGGKKGRITLGLLIVTVIFTDQINSTLIKDLFGRIRPCRALNGVRMLVDCGGGLSFPSSHAVNNFAAAAVISHYYNKQKWYWLSFAGLVAFSRTYVGVHYPSDIAMGGVLGFFIGILFVKIWEAFEHKFMNSNYQNAIK